MSSWKWHLSSGNGVYILLQHMPLPVIDICMYTLKKKKKKIVRNSSMSHTFKSCHHSLDYLRLLKRQREKEAYPVTELVQVPNLVYIAVTVINITTTFLQEMNMQGLVRSSGLKLVKYIDLRKKQEKKKLLYVRGICSLAKKTYLQHL